MDITDLQFEVSRSLANSFDIILGDQLTLGNICKSVFRARRGDNHLVVKIGFTDIEKREIEFNRQGYEKMREIGASNLIPSPLEFISIGEVSLIVMQDCGLDFWHAVHEANDPARLYRRLTEELTAVYRQTLHSSDEAVAVLNSLKQRLIEQYLNYLFPVFGQRKDLLRSLEAASMDSYRPGYICFSSFDFTPEDVFLTQEGLKFADPLPDVVGIPVIDMACFSGVCRDAYELLGAREGYNILHRFAVSIVPDIISLDRAKAKKLFAFGRALQCVLSARFRINREQVKARALFNLSCRHVQSFLSQK